MESEAWLDDNWQKAMQVPHEIFRLERFSLQELSDIHSALAFAQQYVDTGELRSEIRQELRRRDQR